MGADGRPGRVLAAALGRRRPRSCSWSRWPPGGSTGRRPSATRSPPAPCTTPRRAPRTTTRSSRTRSRPCSPASPGSPTRSAGWRWPRPPARRWQRWPDEHHGYRAADVQQMLTLVDEVVGELRAAAGLDAFELGFHPSTPLPPAETLLPPPTTAELGEQLLAASTLAEPAERGTLLTRLVQFIDRAASLLPEAWATRVRASALGTLAADRATDAAYSQLASTSLAAAGRHAQAADVRGIERVRAQVAGPRQGPGRQAPRRGDGDPRRARRRRRRRAPPAPVARPVEPARAGPSPLPAGGAAGAARAAARRRAARGHPRAGRPGARDAQAGDGALRQGSGPP